MPDYHKMYLRLFNAQTDAIESLAVASEMLMKAQRETEEMLMNAPEPLISILKRQRETEKTDETDG